MNVLILEDDIMVAELLNTVVFGLYADVSVTLAGGLGEGRRAWQSTDYDLLICEWHLPDGSGLDLVRHIRQRLREEMAVTSAISAIVQGAVKWSRPGHSRLNRAGFRRAK